MPSLYLAHWEWHTNSEDFSFWRAPGGDSIGSIDLRSAPQSAARGGQPEGYGLFAYDTPRIISGSRSLPDMEAHLTAADKSFLDTELGARVAETQTLQVIRELLLAHADATGETKWKPLRISRRTGAEIHMGGYGRIVADAFSLGHPGLQDTLDVRWADYRRARALAETLLEPERSRLIDALKRNTGHDMLKLYGRTGDDLMAGLVPPEYQSDGWLRPRTTIGDTFTEASDTALESHTATGPNGGFGWTDMTSSGFLDVIAATDIVRSTGDLANDFFRADTDLSSDDHYVQVVIKALGASGYNIGIICRKDSSTTDTYYYTDTTDVGSGEWRTFRRVSGSFTGIGTDSTEEIAVNDEIKMDADGSSIKRYRNDTQVGSTITDTNITGNLRCGIGGDEADWEVDDFEAADLTAATRRVFVVS